MGYVVRLLLPTIQVPETDRPWAYPAQADFALADAWLGQPVPDAGAIDGLALRYLAAFGPATGRDLKSWSGLGGHKELFERLRPKLRVFTDEDGTEVFDLPRAPRPDPDTVAPVRFLPEYDNLLIGYADRTRFVAPEHKGALASKNLFVPATCFVDGMMAATWRMERKRNAAVIEIKPVAKLSRAVRTALQEEGERLARFVEPDAGSHAVTFNEPRSSVTG